MALDTAPKLYSKRHLCAKLETTTGSPVSLSGSDGVDYVIDPVLTYATDSIVIPPHGAFLGNRGIRTGKRSGTASFSLEIRGDGSAPADWFKYMRACGMTLNTATLTPNSAATETITIGRNVDGRLRSISGAMGTFEIQLSSGRPGMVKFDFTGVQQPLVDEAIWSPTYNTVVPPNVSAAAITINSVAYVIPEISITANNEVVLREDVHGVDSGTTPTGYRAAMIVNRRYQVRVSAEALALATINWKAAFDAGTTFPLSIVIGTSANNIFTITAPALRLAEEPGESDRNGILMDDLLFDCIPSSGNDELQIVNT